MSFIVDSYIFIVLVMVRRVVCLFFFNCGDDIQREDGWDLLMEKIFKT